MIDTIESGPITGDFDEVTGKYTNLQDIAVHGHFRLWKVMRYGRWYLLKGLDGTYSSDEAHLQLLSKEFMTLMRLQHPGVVQAIELDDVPGAGRCIVMEYVEGKTLGQWLADGASPAQCRMLLHQLLDAVEYIHQSGIVHRDLKPSNVMVTRVGGQVKVIDFGLADADNNAIFKHAAGTEGYISPEQASGGAPDVRNDIYSLGSIIADMRPLLGGRYDSVVARCRGEIDNRYADVSQLKLALLRVDSVRRWTGRIAALAIAAAVVAATLYILWPRATENKTVAPVAEESAVVSDTVNAVSPAEMSTPSTVLPAAVSAPSAPAALTGREALVQAAIDEGNRRVKAGFPSAALKHHLDTLTSTGSLNQDLMLGGLRIVNAYIEEIKPQFSDRELVEIRDNVYYTHYELYNKVIERLRKKDSQK